MSNEEIEQTDNTEAIIPEVELVITNELERENKLLKEELEKVKTENKELWGEIERLKQAPLSIAVEKVLVLGTLGFHQRISDAHIQLPNATQNKPYSFTFEPKAFKLPDLVFYELTNLEGCGLTFDKTTKTIQGTPNKYGDFSIKLRYKFTDEADNNPFIEKNIPLTINPDPRSLWKNIPSDTTAAYWKADQDKFSLDIGTKKILAASQRGRSHAQDGLFRDDHFQVHYDEASQWCMAVVADGAGSAKYSREGSRLACETIIESLKSLLQERSQEIDQRVELIYSDGNDTHKEAMNKLLYECLVKAAFDAHKKIAATAQENQGLLKDFATTIVFSVMKKYSFGWFIASFGIGDSPMGILVNDEEHYVTHYPEEGDYSGQTYFLTMPEAFNDATVTMARLNHHILPDFKALILMTDGIYDPKFETKANLDKIDLWKDLWAEVSTQIDTVDTLQDKADKLLNWLDFWSLGNHDDRTLVIIY